MLSGGKAVKNLSLGSRENVESPNKIPTTHIFARKRKNFSLWEERGT